MNFWTIDNDGPPSPGVGNALNGLQIQQLTYLGVTTGYQLMNGANLLQAIGGSAMPIQFLGVEFAHRTWNLTNINVADGVNGSGSWAIVGSSMPTAEGDGDNGEFQAQAGTGEDIDDAAASANA